MTLNLTKEVNNINNDEILNNLNLINTNINRDFNININLSEQYLIFINSIKNELHNFFLKIPSFLFQIFIIIFFYYYFSKDYNYELKFFKSKFRHKKYLFLKTEFEKLIGGIIYGQIFVRLVQSIVAIFGFLILGLNSAIISGIMVFFAGFLPVIGTAIIWLPMSAIEFINHNYFIGSMILIIGLFISIIDNILLPYIISEKTNIGPVITLISILGGIQLFGLYGIILGPFFVGTLIIFISDIIDKLKESIKEK